MTIYITERPAARPYASSPRSVEFVDAGGAVVATWTPGGIDDHGTATFPDGSTYPLALQEVRAELGALDYVLTDEFPPARTCSACGAPLESVDGVGIVDARSGDDGGTYDICPARYVEATDTQRGHTL